MDLTNCTAVKAAAGCVDTAAWICSVAGKGPPVELELEAEVMQAGGPEF